MCSVFFRRTMCNVLRKMVQLQAFNFNSHAPQMPPILSPSQYGDVPHFRQFSKSNPRSVHGGGRCVARGLAACAGRRPQAPRHAPPCGRGRRGHRPPGRHGSLGRAQASICAAPRRRGGVRVRTTVPALLGSPILPSPASH